MIGEVFIISLLAFATFFTRIINLLKVPIFTDEAIYIRWAQIGLADPVHRYISLTDGKQPLLTWLMYPMLKIFADPLFAGRFVSVLSGVLAVVAIYATSRELFDKKIAVISSFLYIISPFTLVYDRLALMDSLLAMLGIWSMYLGVVLVRKLRLDAALLLGITVGLGVLTKSSAFFYLYLLPLSLLLFDFRKKFSFSRLAKWIGLACISFIIIQLMYNSLRLSPWFYIIKQKNYTFILTFAEFRHAPFSLFLPNLRWLFQTLVEYITIPISFLIGIGIFWGIWKKDRKLLYLFFFSLFPFLATAAVGKVLYPRFILFTVYPLFIIGAYAIYQIFTLTFFKIKYFTVILLLILAYPLYQVFLVVANPIYANIPISDQNQLFDDWPSGYGVNEVMSYLNEKSKISKIVVGTEGTFGLFPAVFEIYLGRNPNVEIHGYWPVSEVPQELLEASKKHPTYLVFKEKQKIPQDWPLILIAQYRRGKGNTHLLFYQIDTTKWKMQ